MRLIYFFGMLPVQDQSHTTGDAHHKRPGFISCMPGYYQGMRNLESNTLALVQPRLIPQNWWNENPIKPGYFAGLEFLMRNRESKMIFATTFDEILPLLWFRKNVNLLTKVKSQSHISKHFTLRTDVTS